MALKSATCPNCGATLELDDRLEKGVCGHCDSVIIIDDAIQKFKIKVSGRVKMVGIASAENDTNYGLACLAVQDWKTGFDAFTKAIIKQVNNHKAWYGCLSAVTKNFTEINENLGDVKGIYGIDSIVDNAIKYAPKDKKNKVIKQIRKLLHEKLSEDGKIYNAKVDEINKQYRTYKKKTRILLVTGLISLILTVISFSSEAPLVGIMFLAIFILFFNLANDSRKTRNDFKKQKPIKNLKLINLLYQIDNTVSNAVK